MKLIIISGIMAGLGALINILSSITEAYLSKSTFNIIVVGLGLMILALYVNSKLKEESTDGAPSTFILLVEFFKETVDVLVKSTMGENNIGFAPYIFTLFIFLIVSNLLGLVGLDSPTANYSVTLSLALVTFFMSQFFSIKTSGIGGHIKGYFEPMALLSPLNIIGDLANPVSLSFRLFGNILSGGLIMTLIKSGFSYISPFILAPLQIYFDIFSGVLQAFIFTMLTMVFVGSSLGNE